MNSDFGVKAPQLSDGSFLLNEVTLSEDQTKSVKHDAALAEEVIVQSSRALRISLAIDTVLMAGVIGNVVLAFTGASIVSLLLIAVALQIALSVNRRTFQKSIRSYTERLRGVKSLPLVTSSVSNFWAARSYGERLSAYLDLMKNKEIPLGSDGVYRLVLDRSVEDSYVLRVIHQPATTAAAS